MPRQARLDVPGALHHIMLRGINKASIFEDDQDRRLFLGRLEKNVLAADARVYAWALMTNHAHILFKSGKQGIAVGRLGKRTTCPTSFTHACVGLHENRSAQPTSSKTAFLTVNQRVILTDYKTDSAVILLESSQLPLPQDLIPLRPIDSRLSIGVEVGWLGYPAIEAWTMCFFSGNVSARRDDLKAYLIDGVAINGVSGGPVIYSTVTDGVQFVGVMTAYRVNRATGGQLPGLSFAQDVSHFHGVIQHIRSIDEANRKKIELEAEQANIQAANPADPATPPNMLTQG